MKNAVSGLGLAPDAAMINFPIDMFLPGSDIAPLEKRKQEFYDALTGGNPTFAQTAAGVSRCSPSRARATRTRSTKRTTC